MSGRDEARLREALCEAGRLFHQRGLAIGSAGNLSVRLDDGYLVTPTNSSLGRLQPERLSRLAADWSHVAGDKPTKEVAMHRAFYESRPETEAVVHLHSTHASALSFRNDLPAIDPIPIFSPYFVMRVGHLPVLPYFRPGSDEIGRAIAALEGRYRAVLLQNHGPTTSGSSLEAAIGAAEELEETARLYMLIGEGRLRMLDAVEIRDLVETFGLDW